MFGQSSRRCSNSRSSVQSVLLISCNVEAMPASPPKLPAREACALGQRRQLCPGDLRMDAAAEAAIGAGNDVLAPDHVAVTHDAVGHHLRMLDNIGGVTHDAGNEQFA